MSVVSVGRSRREAIAAAGAAVGALGALGLAACGAPGGTSAPDGAPKAAGPVNGPIELMWSTEPVTQEFLERDWIPGFKRENPQAEVSLNIVPGSWDDLFQKIQVSSAAGTPPSLTRGKDYFTGDMAALGLVEPLDAWLKGQKDITPEQYLPPSGATPPTRGRRSGFRSTPSCGPCTTTSSCSARRG